MHLVSQRWTADTRPTSTTNGGGKDGTLVTVTFRGRAAVGLAVPLCTVVLLWSGVVDSLAPTPRGLILATAGITLLGVVLPLQLRTRTLLRHGVKVQGTVVDAEERQGEGPTTCPIAPTIRWSSSPPPTAAR